MVCSTSANANAQVVIMAEQVIIADGWEIAEFICHENQKFLEMTGRAVQK